MKVKYFYSKRGRPKTQLQLNQSKTNTHQYKQLGTQCRELTHDLLGSKALWLFIICTTPCWSHWIRPALSLTCCCPSSHLCSDLSNMLGSSALFHLHQWPPGLYTRTPNLPHDAKPQDARLLCFWSFHCSRGFVLVNGLLRARARPRPAALHDRFSFAASTWPKPAPRVSAITQYQVQLPAWEAALDLCGLLVLMLREDFEDFTSVMLISY